MLVRQILIILSLAITLCVTQGCVTTDNNEEEKIEYFDQ